MKSGRLALIRARIAAWRKLRGGPKARAPRYWLRHQAQANGDLTRRRNRKVRARIVRLVAAAKGTSR